MVPLFAARFNHPASSPWYERLLVELIVFGLVGVFFLGVAMMKVWLAPPRKDDGRSALDDSQLPD